MIARVQNWLNGWRQDMDGWWVRARRATDPDLNSLNLAEIGFVEEASIAVRTPSDARTIDTWKS